MLSKAAWMRYAGKISPTGVLVVAVPAFNSPRVIRPMTAFMAANRAPAIYPYREHVEAGWFNRSMGPELRQSCFRQAAGFMSNRIPKGTSPGELPVQQAATFELLVNLIAAKALGLTITDDPRPRQRGDRATRSRFSATP